MDTVKIIGWVIAIALMAINIYQVLKSKKSDVKSSPRDGTDLENFISLYKSIGIEVKVSDYKNTKVIHLKDNGGDDDYEVTESEDFGGYNGMYSAIWFTDKGKFISQKFWE